MVTFWKHAIKDMGVINFVIALRLVSYAMS